MKRMKVREFRAKLSELTQEPIEVVRYSETVGFWVPIGMTTEPKKSTPRRVKPRISSMKIATPLKPSDFPPKTELSKEDIDRFIERIKKFNEAMKTLK